MPYNKSQTYSRKKVTLDRMRNFTCTTTLSPREQAYILPTCRFEEKPVIIQFLETWTTQLLRAKLNPGQQKDHMFAKVQSILTRIDVVAPVIVLSILHKDIAKQNDP